MRQKHLLFFALCAFLISCSGEASEWKTKVTTFNDLIQELDTLENLEYSVLYNDSIRHIYYLEVRHSNHENFGIFAFRNIDALKQKGFMKRTIYHTKLEFYKVPYSGMIYSSEIIKFRYQYGNNLEDDRYILERTSVTNKFILYRNKEIVFDIHYSSGPHGNAGKIRINEYNAKRILPEKNPEVSICAE